jgi:pyruvate-formate lyase-activating enzyme
MLDYVIAEQLVDSVAMDVKAPLEDSIYARCAGVDVPVSIIQQSIQVVMAAEITSVFRCTVTPTLLEESDVYLLAEEFKTLRTESCSGAKMGPSLTLQNFNPADPMEPDLKKVKPFTEEVLSRMQQEVDRILG